MKTLTTVLTAAFLIAGMAGASAQGTTRQMDEQAGGNSGAVERNPNGTIGGSNVTRTAPSGEAKSIPPRAVKRVARMFIGGMAAQSIRPQDE